MFIKCYDEGKTIRLTWFWAQGIEYAYVSSNYFDKKLFTLQEYKKFGGYILQKKSGVSTYCIEISNEQHQINFTCKSIINISLSQKTNKYKNHKIIFSSSNDIPKKIICYTKDESGITYTLDEPLEAEIPTTRIIRTKLNEKLHLFINEEFSELYNLRECPSRVVKAR